MANFQFAIFNQHCPICGLAVRYMTDPYHILTLTTLLGALGLWLMLPRGTARGRGVGIVLASIALGLGVSQVPRLSDWMADGVFLILAAVTVISAAAAVTFRNPLYCAIWFGQSVLGTAGLFFFAGAQFLAVAAVVVYAGAILVTFLFVLMLAQPEGKAPYDRVSREALVSAVTGIVIVGVLSMTIGRVFSPAEPRWDGNCTAIPHLSETRWQYNCHPNIAPATEDVLAAGILTPQHVARLGGELFGRHLIAVEAAGVLLLVALVGAAAMVNHQRKDH
jgi:NADH-quinone oxidoreductase subunit J